MLSIFNYQEQIFKCMRCCSTTNTSRSFDWMKRDQGYGYSGYGWCNLFALCDGDRFVLIVENTGGCLISELVPHEICQLHIDDNQIAIDG